MKRCPLTTASVHAPVHHVSRRKWRPPLTIILGVALASWIVLILEALPTVEKHMTSINSTEEDYSSRDLLSGGGEDKSETNHAIIYHDSESKTTAEVDGCNDDWSDFLWSGGKAPRSGIESSDPSALTMATVQRIEICVAYCHADLGWIRDAIENELPQGAAIHLTIVSKCNNEVDISDFGGLDNVRVEILQLPNKGGCDLAHVHFIARYLRREAPLESSAPASSTTLLLFLKDSPDDRTDGRVRSVNELVRLASQRDDFVCALELKCWMSAYHDVKTLGRFIANSYRRTGGGPKVEGAQFNPAGYRDLSDFVDRELNWTFPNDEAVQVCYGGQFATTESRLFNGDRATMKILFSRLEQLLMESPAVMNAVEHFAERLWAGILAEPLPPSQVKEILALKGFVLDQQGGHMGAFAAFENSIPGCCENVDWSNANWDALSNKAKKAAMLLGFNEEIWDSDSEVPIYSTPFDKLTNDKKEAVVYLGLRSYFK